MIAFSPLIVNENNKPGLDFSWYVLKDKGPNDVDPGIALRHPRHISPGRAIATFCGKMSILNTISLFKPQIPYMYIF